MERKTKKNISKKADKNAKKKEKIDIRTNNANEDIAISTNNVQEDMNVSYEGIKTMTDEKITEGEDTIIKIDDEEKKPEATEEPPKKTGAALFWIAIIIIILLVAIIFNLDKIMPQKGNETSSGAVARINGQPISQSELDKYYNISVPETMQGAISEDVYLQKSLIPQMVLLQEAAKNNVTVSNDEVDKQLDSLAQTAGMTRQEMISTLATRGVSQDDLNMLYKNKILIEKLLENTLFKDQQVDAPELVRASHILVDTQDKANSILAQIKNGASFEEMAKNYSKDSSAAKGGDLGYFPKGNMVAEFEDAAFNLSKGEVSGVVKTQFGYHIIKVTDKIAGGKMLLKDITNPVQRQLVMSANSDMIQTYTNVLVQKANIQILTNATAAQPGQGQASTTLNMQQIKLDAFAACLSNKGAELYGAEGCQYCEQEKQTFGDSFKKINYIECAKKGDTKQSAACDAKGIEAYPTWVIDGKLYKGYRTTDELSKMTGCLI